MHRRFIPAVCQRCDEPVPRAAAWRCPSCRTEFIAANQFELPNTLKIDPATREKSKL